MRICIAGCGLIAEIHAKAIAEIEDATLVGVSARNGERVLAFAAKHGCTGYTDLIEMLEGEQPDVLCVATPSGTHSEIGIAAAQRGIHVLAEKPIDVTLERAMALVSACSENNVYLGGVFQQRTQPALAGLHAAIAAGDFGRSVLINASVPWWRPDDYYAGSSWRGTLALDGGGALINQAIHAVDLVQWLAQAATGCERAISEVHCMSARIAHPNIEVEDAAVVTMRMTDGSIAQLTATTAMWPGRAVRYNVGGHDGSALIEDGQVIAWHSRSGRPEPVSTAAATGGGSNPGGIPVSAHRRAITDFITAIRNHQPCAVDGIECCKSLEIIEAAYRSARTGQPVILGDSPFALSRTG